MKLNKLFFTLFVAAILVLAACGGNGDDEESGVNEEGEVEQISVFQSKVEISEPLEELAEMYEEETGIEVDVWGTTGDDYLSQLQVRLNSNQGPSILTVQNVQVADQLDSYLYDLSDMSLADDIAPEMGLEYEDRLVGLPYGIEGFGLVYNKDLVDPEDITDYESFVQALQDFEDEGINGLTLSQEAYFLIGHISNYPFSLQDDYMGFIDQLNDGEVAMSETPEFQEFGQFMEAIREHTVNPLDVNYDRQVGDFVNGETAMIHQGNWVVSMLNDYDLDFEVGLMPFPLDGNDEQIVGVGGNWGVNANKDQAEIDAAKDFLEWLHNSDIGQEYMVDEFNHVPGFTHIDADGLDPLAQEVLDASNSGDTIPWAHNYYPADIVPNDLAPATEEFFLDDSMSGEEFIERLDEVWEGATR
ncbi:ABC transporter substrate-binding protein [Alkalibacillus haloalkaliphilus]|uniref:ABC transporter substrate-binding protein n=1 Tax=Alkalibacillus haloalkaliphilus TaxID=94136 RepID=UPI0029354F82|nr:extracellular solute-binding protein [Alkalibacillus haloalkaliphilus]MDV2582238.1 extracellular solute-binding protein [Alkalibacillus haloalkaliphilus]